MEYTYASIVGVVAVVAAELFWLRTGIFGQVTFWVSYAIIVFFQILVDGWLTKLSAPIVTYDSNRFSGIRVPFDIPIEDYLFGFALIALTIMLWERAGPSPGRGPAAGGSRRRTGTARKRPR